MSFFLKPWLPLLQPGKELVNFIRDAKTQQKAMAVAVESRRWRHPERGAIRQPESHCRSQIVRSVVQSKGVAVTQAAIKLRAQSKILPAKPARICACCQ